MSKKVYDNRELSWLKFNMRVLEESEDKNVPLLQRLMFQSIYASNLDEFFMVRVGSLYDLCLTNDNQLDGKTKMRPSQQLEAIYKTVREMNKIKDEAYAALNKELSEKQVSHKKIKNLSDKEMEFINQYYDYEIKPFLNAVVIDRRHPFPFLNNKEIYAVAKLSAKSGIKIGIINCSDKFERVVFLPPENDNEVSFVLVEEIILYFAGSAFSGYKGVEEKALMRVTRNADIDFEEGYDNELDFRQNMSVLISKRKRLCPVRLQLSKELSDDVRDELCKRLELSRKQVFVEKTPLDFGFVSAIMKKAGDKKELFFKPLVPQKSADVDDDISMIEQIDRKDILLSYPYQSIEPFIRLLNEAAQDPTVVSIKMTLYRVAQNSKIIKALCKAAENGKNVVVLMELRARFDEENNIQWSKYLEESGCQIMYGPQGKKVHSKLCLITRKIGSQVKYTTQIGTGNYNEKTAELYTDLCLMTSDTEIAEDAVSVFNALSTGNLVKESNVMLVAPYCLQNKVIDMMEREIDIARSGGEGYVAAKLNSLTDKVLIDKIIECSQAGVKVDLIVRGISCLVAGVKGYTENVHIISIVGRYLEHARIYIFGKGARCSVYISSADYMTRNTRRRVEVAVPILDEDIKKRLLGYFDTELSDNVKAREQQSDGSYVHVPTVGVPLNSQIKFYEEAYASAEKALQEKQRLKTAAESDGKEKKHGILNFFRKLFRRKKSGEQE
ncbi:MAG: polyphosphate kinase 1 [Oscillospiraceae bacterium]